MIDTLAFTISVTGFALLWSGLKRRYAATLSTARLNPVAMALDPQFDPYVLAEAGEGDGVVASGAPPPASRVANDVFDQLARSIEQGVCIHRDEVLYASPAFAAALGTTPQALVGRDIVDLVHPDFRDVFTANVRACWAGPSGPRRYQVQIVAPNGGGRWFEFASTVIDYRGDVALLTLAAEAEQRVEPEALAGSRLAFEALESMPEGMLITDAQGRIEYLNGAAAVLIGADRDTARGRPLRELVTLVEENTRRSLGDPLEQCLTRNVRVSLNRRAVLLVNGSREYSIEFTASPLRDAEGQVAGAAVLLRDVTEQRGLTRQMSYQASHDALTGLINRREFERRLEDALQSARAGDAAHVLCYLDLDRFKLVNDSCGHMAGDGMLREVAGLIRGAVRDSDTVGRIGGDEFGVLLNGCPLPKARQIADDVQEAIKNYRFVWRDKIFNIGVSIGLVEIGLESGSLEDSLSAADSACYVAKQHGSHVHVYSARDEAVARHRGEIQWLQRLQNALRDNRFELYTQPIVSLSGRVETGPAFEVLLRLQDEAGVEISPADFMRAAERYRLMAHVDRWVVQTTLAALGRGGIKLPDRRSVSINLSGQTLGDPGFLEFVVDCLDHTGVVPAQICFEVTESSVVTNISHARRFIGVLHGMGCQFALDDFGSGLGSFANLKDLSMDYLKIDGSFIRNLSTDSVNQAMVTALVRLARTLNFRVVAEQVEDQTSFEAAKKIGVDFVQGFLVGRPQPLVGN